MALSWNDIKERATQFSKEWETAQREESLNRIFRICGISRIPL